MKLVNVDTDAVSWKDEGCSVLEWIVLSLYFPEKYGYT